MICCSCKLIVTFDQFISKLNHSVSPKRKSFQYFHLVSSNKSFEISIPFRYNEYDWCPLDIAIMLNNIPMIQLLVQYGAFESSKSKPKKTKMKNLIDCSVVPSEEYRYQSVCHQLSNLSQQNSDETIKKSPSNKLTTDDGQVCHNHKNVNLQ